MAPAGSGPSPSRRWCCSPPSRSRPWAAGSSRAGDTAAAGARRSPRHALSRAMRATRPCRSRRGEPPAPSRPPPGSGTITLRQFAASRGYPRRHRLGGLEPPWYLTFRAGPQPPGTRVVSGLGIRQLVRGDDPTTVAVDGDTTIVGATTGPAAGAAPPPASVRRDTTVFPGFDGLRAIAAVLVLVVHTGFMTTLTLQSRFGPYVARAEIGVAVFFLISGFLLYRPFVARHLALAERGGGRDVPEVGGFWIRRFLRIVPLYWLVFVISLVVITDKMIVANVRG